MKLLKPVTPGLTCSAKVPGFTTKVIAVIQQIDSYKPANLKVKYSWA